MYAHAEVLCIHLILDYDCTSILPFTAAFDNISIATVVPFGTVFMFFPPSFYTSMTRVKTQAQEHALY